MAAWHQEDTRGSATGEHTRHDQRRMVGVRLLAAGSALALLVAACGGGGAGDSPGGSAADASVASTAGETRAPAASGDGGTLTVDGESYPVVFVVQCVPRNSSSPDDLTVVAFSEDRSVGVDFDVTFRQANGPQGATFDQSIIKMLLGRDGDQFESRTANNIEGNWFVGFVPQMAAQEGDTPLDRAPFTIEGNRISGSLTLEQSWPQDVGGTVDLDFDVTFPSNAQVCS